MPRKYTRKLKGGDVNIDAVKTTIIQLKDDVIRISNDIEELGKNLEIPPTIKFEKTYANNKELNENYIEVNNPMYNSKNGGRKTKKQQQKSKKNKTRK